MYRKMLVLLDGSKLAEVVFRYAQELSARLNINLELLHVCSPQEAEQLPMRQAYMEHMAEIFNNKTAEILSRIGEIGDKTASPKVKATVKMLVGYPAEQIVKYADDNNIDLIMLSTHGQSGIRVWDIGNVANKVIHASKTNIWMVPSELREEVIRDRVPKRTIIVTLDGTKLSESVIPHAINLTKQRGAECEIVLIHVDTGRQQAEKIDGKKYLDDMVKGLGEEGVQARAKLLKGDASETIVNFVEKNPAQLLVMATHPHAGRSISVFSSVTENVVHMVKTVPILVVKPMGSA
jgi:nucleotide-binding universal stress UspA family protein